VLRRGLDWKFANPNPPVERLLQTSGLLDLVDVGLTQG
jgi:hypothetical protein